MINPRLRQYPQNGAIVIANGDNYPIKRGGTFIRVKTASQSFKLVVDDVEEYSVEQNDVFRFREAPFKELRVENNSGSALTFQLEIGDGSVETNNVSISGTLKADDDETQALLTTIDGVLDNILGDTGNIDTNIADIEVLLTNTDDKRTSLTKYGANNVAATSISGSVTTLITPAANTSGLWLRSICINSSTSHRVEAYADTAAPSGIADTSKRMLAISSTGNTTNRKDFFIPSGIGLYAVATGSSSANVINVVYD